LLPLLTLMIVGRVLQSVGGGVFPLNRVVLLTGAGGYFIDNGDPGSFGFDIVKRYLQHALFVAFDRRVRPAYDPLRTEGSAWSSIGSTAAGDRVQRNRNLLQGDAGGEALAI
jgi:hypothetical protein